MFTVYSLTVSSDDPVGADIYSLDDRNCGVLEYLIHQAVVHSQHKLYRNSEDATICGVYESIGDKRMYSGEFEISEAQFDCRADCDSALVLLNKNPWYPQKINRYACTADDVEVAIQNGLCETCVPPEDDDPVEKASSMEETTVDKGKAEVEAQEIARWVE